jgi:signal transduction histidine kinase
MSGRVGATRDSLIALEGAARRLAESAEALREDMASSEEVAQTAGALVAHIRALAGDDVLAEALPVTPLARRILTRLRSCFLDQVRDEALAAEEMVPVLLAMEQVQDRQAPSFDQEFADRLSGPDGLDLVVEVAHDLRSPLTSILFLAETLLRGRSGPVTALQERQLGLIYSAAFGLSSVASDVVELVRGRERRLDIEPMPFSINDLFESVQGIVHPIAEEKRLEVRLVHPDRPFRVGHPVALNRVLLNLVTNALKFTDEGVVELAATAGAGDAVRFSVHDTGRGIPPHAMALLYAPFRRRQREGEYAFSGSGLGLSICRKFVEAMGGRLEVNTELGKGTEFHFELGLPEPALNIAAG